MSEGIKIIISAIIGIMGLFTAKEQVKKINITSVLMIISYSIVCAEGSYSLINDIINFLK
jgi:hypothetical protein